MKQLKDYLHLYLGCEVEWTQYAGKHSSGIYGTDYFNSFLLREIALKNGEAKPILRPLSDTTKEEVGELLGITANIIRGNFEAPFFQIVWIGSDGQEGCKHAYIHQLSPTQFLYLLSKHFDLFGLIPELAIDKTTLTINPNP